MLDGLILSYKKQGETPLMCLERERVLNNIDKQTKMTYAGRLDPMAEGLLIILIGEECKNKEQYLGLDKAYEFEILVGFDTDTHDLLGIITSSIDFAKHIQTIPEVTFDFASTLQSFIGTFIQKYPNFSSKTIDGKQLFQLAKDNELPENIPEHKVTIYALKATSVREISKEELKKELINKINLVYGDFRQKEILKRWNDIFESITKESFEIISCEISCSSGTYIRQLVADIGKKLDIPLVTYSILRTRVGDYQIKSK